MITLAFSTPISTVHAGFFSWFSNNLLSSANAASEVDILNVQTMPILEAVRNSSLTPPRGGGGIVMVDGSALLPESGPIGTTADIEDRTSDAISIYIVHKGDTISAIAKMFGVSVNTIMWGNDLKSSLLTEGQQLVILPISGVRHTVKAGDTVASIAKQYKGDIKEILQFNDISENQKLIAGDIVIIPDGEIVTPKIVVLKSTSPAYNISGPNYTGYYSAPLHSYVKTQGLHGYNGVDLAAPSGTPIYASAEGDVIIARGTGWNGGYGQYVVISHSNNTQTLYSHASRVIISEGTHVFKGQIIGYVGATGKSTGTHLHFEVRGARNPF